MARKKKTARPLPPWASALPDCRDPCFIQVGTSVFCDDKFKALGASAFKLYFCCMSESAGKINFQMPLSKAEKYGFSASTFRRALAELEKSGFIQTTRSGKSTRTASDYQFSFKWRDG